MLGQGAEGSAALWVIVHIGVLAWASVRGRLGIQKANVMESRCRIFKLIGRAVFILQWALRSSIRFSLPEAPLRTTSRGSSTWIP